MIKIKLLQGATRGHGGVLSAPKNTVQIARIRGVFHIQPYFVFPVIQLLMMLKV